MIFSLFLLFGTGKVSQIRLILQVKNLQFQLFQYFRTCTFDKHAF